MEPDLGRALVVLGIALVVAGLLVSFGTRLPLGHLPGDFHFHRGRTSIHLPLGSSLLVSLVLTVLLNLLLRLRR